MITERIDWHQDHFNIPIEVYHKLSKTYDQFKTQLPMMEIWYLANPSKHKKNIMRFMVNWMTQKQGDPVRTRREQDDQDFRDGMVKAKEAAVGPPSEWSEMKAKLRRVG